MNRAVFFDAAGLDTPLADPWQLTLGGRYQQSLANGYRIVLSGNLALIDYSSNGFEQIEEPEYPCSSVTHRAHSAEPPMP